MLKKFSFNNNLYLHIRNDQYFDANIYLRKIIIKFVDLRKTFSIIVYANISFIVKIIKIISIVITIISTVIFNVNLFKNIDIDCDYRD